MVLFKGVCEGLRDMHCYKVQKGPRKKARNARKEAQRAQEEDEEGEGFLENEASLASEGVPEGQTRSYAHRDIKPGMRDRS